ncbi:MAG: NAD(P)/FAD-dependent oxidoreductase [Athalassotoga sp.]|uniref:NAD(P)/FAD-dependent oxidoreductase n=1 Tax=Athalassotoga sp. TaxID=2022597 RepID=UPI003D017C75
MKMRYDVVVLGGGAAGMGAVKGAKDLDASVLLIEREPFTGGVLNQCIHTGFGLQVFKMELTGPEYHEFYRNKIGKFDALYETMVLNIDFDENKIKAMNSEGIHEIEYGALVLATGARERPFEALRVPGTRPAGIFTAGLAQKFVNLENHLPGHRAVIIGSGDIGMIMARRLFLEGVKIEGVYEIMPYPGGLTRNVAQCLEDFNIPLHLSTSVVKIHGKRRLEGVTVAKFENNSPVEGSERFIECDTLVASVGLIPENDLVKGKIEIGPDEGIFVDDLMRTNYENVFACGNNVCIHDLVDFTTTEGEVAGRNAAMVAKGESLPPRAGIIIAGSGIRILSIHYTTATEPFKLYVRVDKPMEIATVNVNDKPVKAAVNARPSEMIELTLNPQKIDLKGKIIVSAKGVKK